MGLDGMKCGMEWNGIGCERIMIVEVCKGSLHGSLESDWVNCKGDGLVPTRCNLCQTGSQTIQQGIEVFLCVTWNPEYGLLPTLDDQGQ